MFKRRKKPKWSENFRNFLWPKIGWHRWMQYHRHRVGRIPDSPYRIAAGLACGVAVSFTPFLGFHLLLAVVCAYTIRANMIAGAVGTIIGNPWTFPIIWAVTYNIGAKFTGIDQTAEFSELIDTDKLLTNPLDALEPVFVPMMHGGLIVGIIIGWASYFIFYKFIITYRNKRQARIYRRTKQQALEEEKLRELKKAKLEEYGVDDDNP